MHHHRIAAAASLVLWATALLGCSGCADRPAGEPQGKTTAALGPAGHAAQDAGAVDYEELMLHRRTLPSLVRQEWFVATGEVDKGNRYSPTVQVYENQLEPEEVVRLCSGVLVSPRLVVTAANCLCPRREAAPGSAGKFLSDGTACVTTATIKTVAYLPPSPGARSASLVAEYDGTVRIHPAFKMLLDEQGNVVSSEADLATIALEEPVELPAVEIAEPEVKAREPLVVVGYGYDKRGVIERRFSKNPVTKVLTSGGRVAFAQPSPQIFKGARGGPCLRETGKGTFLVGVLGARMGQEASFTSVSPYRAWLLDEIRRAAEAGAVTPGAP